MPLVLDASATTVLGTCCPVAYREGESMASSNKTSLPAPGSEQWLKLIRAAWERIARLERIYHPFGHLNNRGHWWPDRREVRPCCTSQKAPDGYGPFKLKEHCRTLRHVAARHDVTERDLRAMVDHPDERAALYLRLRRAGRNHDEALKMLAAMLQ